MEPSHPEYTSGLIVYVDPPHCRHCRCPLFKPFLSQRETEVLALIAQGYKSREIALALSIERETVQNHVNRIMNKLGVHSRQAAIAYYLTYDYSRR